MKNILRRHTLAQSTQAQGIGVHSGCDARIALHPAPAGHGICFRKEGSGPSYRIDWRCISETRQRTGLSFHPDFHVFTVEHLLSACYGMGITDLLIDVWGQELPLFDGSAKVFTQLFKEAGIVDLGIERYWVVLKQEIEVSYKESWMVLTPGFPSIDVTTPLEKDLNHRAVFDLLGNEFETHVAPARTFAKLEDIEALTKAGLIKGGNLSSALVLHHGHPINPGGFRVSQECAYHKILDCLGDFSLLGHGLYAQITAYRPGHTLNAMVIKKMMQMPSTFEICLSSQLSSYPEYGVESAL